MIAKYALLQHTPHFLLLTGCTDSGEDVMGKSLIPAITSSPAGLVFPCWDLWRWVLPGILLGFRMVLVFVTDIHLFQVGRVG